MKLTDEKKTVEITMYDINSVEWSNDFFESANLEYSEEKEAYVVPDVGYCIEQAKDWETGVGDYYTDDSTGRTVYID